MCRILAGNRRKGEKGGGKDWPKLCLFCQSPYLSRLDQVCWRRERAVSGRIFFAYRHATQHHIYIMSGFFEELEPSVLRGAPTGTHERPAERVLTASHSKLADGFLAQET